MWKDVSLFSLFSKQETSREDAISYLIKNSYSWWNLEGNLVTAIPN